MKTSLGPTVAQQERAFERLRERMKQPAPISLETACERILGKNAAQAIIREQSLEWALVAAAAAARKSDDPQALEEISKYLAACKAKNRAMK